MSDGRKKTVPPAIRFLISSNSSCVGILFSHPFDMVKTRMQIAALVKGKPYTGMTQAFRSVVRNDGVFGLYNGVGAALLRQVTNISTRFSLYAYLNEMYRIKMQAEPSVLTNVGMGIIAGAVGAFIGTPADVVVVRMTTDTLLKPEDQRHYKNVFDALIRIAREEGVINMWRGCMPTIIRAMVTSSSQLASYSSFRRQFRNWLNMKEGILLDSTASMASGLVTTICAIPVDMIKTRIQNQKIAADGTPEYSSAFDVLGKLIKNEGFFTLWRGFWPYFLRVAPPTVVIFLLIEEETRLYKKYVLGIEDSKSDY